MYNILLNAGNQSPPAATVTIDFTDCKDIMEGFVHLTSKLSETLQSAKFSTLKRALLMKTPGGVQFPDNLKKTIKEANDFDALMDALVESKYWNFADLRLPCVLVISSGIRVAMNLVDKYKETFFGIKLVDILKKFNHEVLSPDKHREYACRVGSKINKEPHEVTVADLGQYCTTLETVIMDVNEGSCILEHIEKGCVKIYWLIPIHSRLHAYKSALRNRHRFHSFHLEYLKIESYPVIYDQFTIQPTILSTLMCSPNPVVCKCVCVYMCVYMYIYIRTCVCICMFG